MWCICSSELISAYWTSPFLITIASVWKKRSNAHHSAHHIIFHIRHIFLWTQVCLDKLQCANLKTLLCLKSLIRLFSSLKFIDFRAIFCRFQFGAVRATPIQSCWHLNQSRTCHRYALTQIASMELFSLVERCCL